MKRLFFLMLLMILGGLLYQPVSAQESEFTLYLRRDFGYGAGSSVRGRFTISLVGDESRVEAVTFLIDGESMAAVDGPPFRYQFHTDDFGFGVHRLTAEVRLADGSLQVTPGLQYNFISPKEERQQVTTIFVGIGGAILVATAVVALVQMVMMQGKNGRPRRYGLLGATICPKCGRPYPRHLWGMNLLVGRLDRCSHCGQWALTSRATPAALQMAEEMENQGANDGVELPDLSADRKSLEDTKFFDDM